MVAVAVVGRVALSQSAPGFSAADTRDAGPAVTRAYAFEGFERLSIEDAWRVRISRGDGWSVELSFPENREGEIEARVRGDRLTIARESPRWRFWGNDEDEQFTAHIVMPVLVELDSAGASRIEFSGFSGDELALGIAGAVTLEGRDGRYEALELSVAGASDIDLRGVTVNSAHVELAGASDVTLAMNGGELTGSMAGASTIDYYGTVTGQSVEIAGVGSVRQRN
jgi:hypothetical protein